MHTADILILGSGLAGLRAAWSAAARAPGLAPALSIVVASQGSGPSGSSFANANNALGYQLLTTDMERESFVREASGLAAPGFFDPRLAEILALESEARFRDMETLDLGFRRDPSGTLVRYPGCGSPDPRAVVFSDLAHAFSRYRAKCESLGVGFMDDFTALGLLTTDGSAAGAWGLDRSGQTRIVRARCVIVALGGPAPLYARHMAGPGNPGLGLGLLRQAGVRLANARYLQFMWGAKDNSFRTPARLLAPGNRVVPPQGPPRAPEDRFGPSLSRLLTLRDTHCPALYGHEDSRLDQWLLAGEHPDGLVRVQTPGGPDSPNGQESVALMAHAGNGGAMVDSHGETSVPGLFAVGECATGMHGANRMGGAMVLATQVFGHRAGERAAARGSATPLPAPDRLATLMPDHRPQENDKLKRIRDGLTEHATFTRHTDHHDYLEFLGNLIMQTPDARLRLAALAALTIVEDIYREEAVSR